jgi:hypothetical protein
MMMMNRVQFGKAFLLQDDLNGAPLANRGLAQQAQENFQAKNPHSRVILHEQKYGEGLYYRGSEFFLLTDETADAFTGIQQQSRAKQNATASKAQARPNLQEFKKQLAKLEADKDSAMALTSSVQFSTAQLETLKGQARKAASLQSRESLQALQTQLNALHEKEQAYLEELFQQAPQQALKAEINGLKQQAECEAKAKFDVDIERVTLAHQATIDLLNTPPSTRSRLETTEALQSNFAKQQAALQQLSKDKASFINNANRRQILKLETQLVDLNQAALKLAKETFAPQIAALETQIETVKADALKAEEAKLAGQIQMEEEKAAANKNKALQETAGRYTGQIDSLKAKIAETEKSLPPESASIFTLNGIRERFQQFQESRVAPKQIHALLSDAKPLAVRSELNVRTPLLTEADGVGVTRQSLFFGHQFADPYAEVMKELDSQSGPVEKPFSSFFKAAGQIFKIFLAEEGKIWQGIKESFNQPVQ